MSTQQQKHRGVSVVPPPKPGWDWQLSFKHPLLGKQVKRVAGTKEGAVAQEYARKLSVLVYNRELWEKVPDDFPEQVKRLWRTEAVDPKLVAAMGKVAKFVKWNKGSRGGFSGKHNETAHAADAVTTAASVALADAKVLRDRVAFLESENDELRAILRKLGKDEAAAVSRKSILQAAADYIKNGAKCGPRKLQSVSAWVNRFAKSIPETTRVSDVKADSVIKHLEDFLAGRLVKVPDGLPPEDVDSFRRAKTPEKGTVRSCGRIINAFLIHQTKGHFKKFDVVDWIKEHCNGADDEDANPYWLDQKQVDALLKPMPKFWRDAAELQWAGAFRPEELCYLMADKVTFNTVCRVGVARIRDDHQDPPVTIWKPKTKRSVGAVHVPKDFHALVRRLAFRKRFLLLPNDKALHGGVETQWGKGHDFEKERQMWRAGSFTEQYLAQLRAAAEVAGLEKSRIDSRTLRRSAGKRFLLASSSLEQTAAFMRDLPETVRRHYARLLPDDVTQPEPHKK